MKWSIAEPATRALLSTDLWFSCDILQYVHYPFIDITIFLVYLKQTHKFSKELL